jgi:hypothetical protein
VSTKPTWPGAKGLRGKTSPLFEGADETFFIQKTAGLRNLFDGLLCALQLRHSDIFAHAVFELLQRRALFFELSMQRSR